MRSRISLTLNGWPSTLERSCGDQVLRAKVAPELAVVELRHQHLIEAAEHLAEIARERIQVAQVDARDVAAILSRVVRRPR